VQKTFSDYLQSRQQELLEGGEVADIFDLLTKKYQFSIKKGEQGQKDELIITADDMESGFEIASRNLGVDISKLQYRVIENGSKGIFGIAARPYKIAFSIMDSDISLEDALEAQSDELVMDFGEEVSPDADGFAELYVSKKGKFLIIHPPRGEGEKCTLQQAKTMLQEKEITDVDDATIQMLIDRNDAEPYRIGEWVENKVNDGKLFIDVADDKMKAYLRIVPPKKDGRYIDNDDVDILLREKRITHGIKQDAIQNALDKKMFNMPVLIAEGTPVKHGQDAYIDYKIDIKEKVNFANVPEDEQVDFKKMDLIVNVMAEQLLAEKVPAGKGEDGYNIYHTKLEARDGNDIELKGGENTYITEDGMQLKSTINGHAVMKQGVISILPVYEVKGDVGPQTGNIKNIGDVVVHGNVLDGYTVKAGGNIEVAGTVGASTLEATGDITIKLGVNGHKKGSIVSKNGNFFSKYIQETGINITGDVFVTEYILNSQVSTNGSILLNGKKARIVGGKCTALKEITAKDFGSAAGVTTIVAVGVLPEIRHTIEKLQTEIETDEEKLSNLKLDIQTYENHKEDEEKTQKLEEMKNEYENLEKEVAEKKEQLVQAQERLEKSQTVGKITAQKNVYSNVIMYCNTGYLENKRDQRASYYTVDEAHPEYVKYHPYKKSTGRRK